MTAKKKQKERRKYYIIFMEDGDIRVCNDLTEVEEYLEDSHNELDEIIEVEKTKDYIAKTEVHVELNNVF